MKQILLCDWLPKRERWNLLAHCVLQEKSPQRPFNKSFIN